MQATAPEPDLRFAVLTLAALAFAAGLLIEPAALAEIARYCLRGYCGVRPLWIESLAAVALGVLVLSVVIARRKPKPKPKRKRSPPATTRRPKA